MEYNIAVVDDNIEDLNLIVNTVQIYFASKDFQANISQYNDSNAFPTDKFFDLIFLDIDMVGKTGFELAKAYKIKHKDILIVFITNHKELVYDACNIHPFDFIRKENILLDIPKVIEDAILKLNDLYPTVTFYCNGNIYVINKNEIIFCESFNHNTEIHYGNKSLNVCLQLSNVSEKIDLDYFYRVSRSYYVNMKKVIKLDGTTLFLTNNYKIQISRRKKSNIQKYLSERK
ncbi:MAG: LytTR family DNA-binding domain-containing protein [Bacilli bacterium]